MEIDTNLAISIRSMIEFEIIRMNDRIKTLYTVQGLMFVALGFAWGKSPALLIGLTIAGLIAVSALGAFVQHSVNTLKKLESYLYDASPKENENINAFKLVRYSEYRKEENVNCKA